MHLNNLKASWIWWKILCGLLLLLGFTDAKPQDFFETVAVGAVQAVGQIASTFANGAALSKDHNFEVPFGKVNSKSEIGMGEAVVHRSYADSSEEDRRRRRRRSLNGTDHKRLMQAIISSSHIGHNHRGLVKRAACWGGMGMGGTGGGGGGDDVDVVERMRRLARQRQAAQKKKASQKSKAKTKTKSTSTKTKKKLIDSAEHLEPLRRRRRRQTEVDDLNSGTNSTDISQYAQQFAEKVRGFWENIAKSWNNVKEQIKQAMAGNQTDSGQTM